MCWLLLWISLLISDVVGIKTLQCHSTCHKRRTRITLDNRQKLSCTIAWIKRPPTATPEIGIAPAPALIDKQMWYVHRNSKMALNVTWMQKESDLSNRLVKGYYMTVEDPNMAMILRYRVSIKISGRNKTETKSTDHIVFQFLCHGLINDPLSPKSKRIIAIESLPLADMKHQDGQIQQVVTILAPGLNNRRTVAKPDVTELTTLLITREKSIESKNMQTLILVAALSSIALISAVAILFFWKRRRIHGKSYWRGNALVIADTDHDTNIQTHHVTMEKLAQKLGFKMRSNWSSRNMISQESAAIWFKEQIQKTNIIILIEPPESLQIKDNNEYQQFWHLILNSRQRTHNVFLQRRGQEHRYDVTGFKNFKIFPLKHEYTTKDTFYKHMKKWSKVTSETRDKERMNEKNSTDCVKSGARPKCNLDA